MNAGREVEWRVFPDFFLITWILESSLSSTTELASHLEKEASDKQRWKE